MPTFAYPAFAEIKTIYSPQALLSGKKQRIHRDREIGVPDIVAGTVDIVFVTLNMTLKRIKTKKKRRH